MDYQVQSSYEPQREYEAVIDDAEGLYIPRVQEKTINYGVNNKTKEKEKVNDEKRVKYMYAQLVRVFKEINTGQLYIEASTLLKLRGANPNNNLSDKYSSSLIPITSELLAELIKDYERRYEVHVDIEVLPIDLVNNHTYETIDDFIYNNKDYKVNNKENELNNIFNEDNNKYNDNKINNKKINI